MLTGAAAALNTIARDEHRIEIHPSNEMGVSLSCDWQYCTIDGITLAIDRARMLVHAGTKANRNRLPSHSVAHQPIHVHHEVNMWLARETSVARIRDEIASFHIVAFPTLRRLVAQMHQIALTAVLKQERHVIAAFLVREVRAVLLVGVDNVDDNTVAWRNHRRTNVGREIVRVDITTGAVRKCAVWAL
eukprot:CAMPEP_0202692496 /NCGR_PEP_ID=MMETSP1385-20130828/6855_1 /ASSEMBLY_ACC=CAM_ASM_000861 /TAXON_ID=933848 /ORGANISM="Elphidium margaritaceum" /LENGTH=188 /DNA_ID=CAMNT_0049348033 /DNA_START=145 /DNA_END=711 /DNA_ORIENTATION=-